MTATLGKTMLDIIREIKDHVIHLAHLVRNSNTAPLTDKIQAKEVEQQSLEKLDSMLSMSPYGGEKLVREYLTVGDASKVTSLGMSSMNIALTNFSSLFFNKEKEITNINFASPLQGTRVVNTFIEMKGTLKAVISTATTSYGLVLGDDSHYHIADMKFWNKLE